MITVVGIGADGWDGLGAGSRSAIRAAEVLMGSARQLSLIPIDAVAESRRELLPSPLLPELSTLAACDGLCLLASGDPMLHGLGATLSRLVPAGQLRVLPAVSSMSLAAARLIWPLATVAVVSLVSSPASSVLAALTPGGRLLVLVRDASTVAGVAEVLVAHGWGASTLTVLSSLGGPDESVAGPVAASSWGGRGTPALSVLAIEACPDHGVAVWPRGIGLPDEAFASDGALTRREVRMLVVAALRPAPGELLWDIGAGSGSIAIEWLRAAGPTAGGIALEPRADRRERIALNALALGAPQLSVVDGLAPAALAQLQQPQAVFIGGGVTVPGVLEQCWEVLPVGGRLVATAVTIETEAVLHTWKEKVGGTLTRLELSRASPLGSFTTWRPELPIVIWEVVK